MDDPNAEAWWSLGRRWVLRRALWWASLATLWKPLLIMAECQDPGFAWIDIEADSRRQVSTRQLCLADGEITSHQVLLTQAGFLLARRAHWREDDERGRLHKKGWTGPTPTSLGPLAGPGALPRAGEGKMLHEHERAGGLGVLQQVVRGTRGLRELPYLVGSRSQENIQKDHSPLC